MKQQEKERSFLERFKNAARPMSPKKEKTFSEERVSGSPCAAQDLNQMRQKNWTRIFPEDSLLGQKVRDEKGRVIGFKDEEGALYTLEQMRKDTKEILCLAGVFIALALGSTSCACMKVHQARQNAERAKIQDVQEPKNGAKPCILDWTRNIRSCTR